MPEPFIVAHISDPHISLGGDNATGEAELERAVDHLLHLPTRPDVVLLTGDGADHGDPAEYERLRELLRPLPMPVYVIPGNHDDRNELMNAFGPQGTQPLPGFAQYVVEAGPLRLIALDTGARPGRGPAVRRAAGLAGHAIEPGAGPTDCSVHAPPAGANRPGRVRRHRAEGR